MDKEQAKRLLIPTQSMMEVWKLCVHVLEEILEAPDAEQPTDVDPKPRQDSACRADYLPGPPVISEEGAIPRESTLANADPEAEPVEITFPRPKKPRKQRSDKGKPRKPRAATTETGIPDCVSQEQLYDCWRNLRQELTDQDVAGIFKAVGVQTITAVTPAAQLVAAIQWAEKLKA